MNAQQQELNLVPGGVPPVVNTSQYDIGRTFQFSLWDGNTAFTIPNNATVQVSGGKPDNHGFAYSPTDGVIDIDPGRQSVTIHVTQQMTCVEGETICEVSINDGDSHVGTANFIIQVEKGPINDDTIVSDTEIPAIIEGAKEDAIKAQRAAAAAQASETSAAGYATAASGSADSAAASATSIIGSVDAAAGYATAAAGSANTAAGYVDDTEAWANGTRDGQAIPYTDPAYNKHGKYWNTQAEWSATAAAGSATTASEHKENAEAWAVGTKNGTAVPSTAPQYHNSAKYWAEQAAAVVGIGIATTTTAGIVKPDGETITVQNDGTISFNISDTQWAAITALLV